MTLNEYFNVAENSTIRFTHLATGAVTVVPVTLDCGYFIAEHGTLADEVEIALHALGSYVYEDFIFNADNKPVLHFVITI